MADFAPVAAIAAVEDAASVSDPFLHNVEAIVFSMDCNHPFFLTKQLIYVPCGKCFACRIARAREWKYRLTCEMLYYTHGYFVTLTYNDDTLPTDYALDKRHLQLYIKRLRKLASMPLKHFSVGEYGGKTSRPHYHLIVLTDQADLDTAACWHYGNVFVGDVTPDSIGYVTGYLTKKFIDEATLCGRTKPFQLQSQGLGLRYLIDNDLRLDIERNDNFNGHKIALPKYYKSYLPALPAKTLVEKEQQLLDTLNRLCKPKIPLLAIDDDFTQAQIRTRQAILPLRELTMQQKFKLSRKDKL